LKSFFLDYTLKKIIASKIDYMVEMVQQLALAGDLPEDLSLGVVHQCWNIHHKHRNLLLTFLMLVQAPLAKAAYQSKLKLQVGTIFR
jgi:hypothetical protein